jgi:dihydroxyacetone kinase-like protein
MPVLEGLNMHASTTLADASSLREALGRWCNAMEAATPELNDLDGRLGDGDLGTTLSKCAVNVREQLARPADSLESLLQACAKACAKASGSSFGTLLAIGFMHAAKACASREALDRDGLADLLTSAQQAISARGGAATGDKTMLDSLDAIAGALRQSPAAADAQALKQVASAAAQAALETFRDRPNRIGRARMFAERSVGMDDPGMVAVRRMAEAL